MMLHVPYCKHVTCQAKSPNVFMMYRIKISSFLSHSKIIFKTVGMKLYNWVVLKGIMRLYKLLFSD